MEPSLLPALSRSYKARQYVCIIPKKEKDTGLTESQIRPDKIGKRKRSDDDSPPESCNDTMFEVRPCRNGIGMFATRDIDCGSLIVDREDPLVSTCRRAPEPKSSGTTITTTTQSESKFFCHWCVAPLGNLANHVMRLVPDAATALTQGIVPYLANETGPHYTTDEQVVECKSCLQVRWCSEQCAEAGQPRHQFLCQGIATASTPLANPPGTTLTDTENHSTLQQDPLESFYSTLEDPSIFKLCVDGVAAILAAAMLELEKQGDQETAVMDKPDVVRVPDTRIFHFWKDYGSHPRWWEVGNPAKFEERTSQCQTFTKLLLQNVFSPPFKSNTSETLLGSMVTELCTLENMGRLLGMLQCNVMEFEYPSPMEQFMNHLQQESEDDENEEQEQDKDSAVNQWLNRCAVGGDTQVLGFGLYPLLTLANHSCDPNASIDFLKESNKGSMVALRDIRKGDEICITYVPNGDLDADGPPERFRHFEPTRTWKWLNRNQRDIQEEIDNWEDDASSDCSDEPSDDEKQYLMEGSVVAGKRGDSPQHGNLETPVTNHGDDDDSDEVVEGNDQSRRAELLLDYGFECRCTRCSHEMLNPHVPYGRVC